ncbi:WXG100 family type VII secretion target [Nocardia sp. NPDC049526]|uniref:WXG100 family type VII secretion target n=1 Tax=Nocardia sp. NPDC049526 TaxID=3364316 RepID=UPI0037BA4DD6
MTDSTTATDPTQKLMEPQVEAWFTVGGKMVDFVLGNAYSVANYLNLIISLTGWDPVELVQKYFGGDWEELLKSARAVENLAAYNTAYGEAIDAAMKNVESSWQGNAATSADDYFSKLKTALDGQVEPLTEIANGIASFAWTSFSIAQTVQALMLELGDWIIKWLLTKAAAVAARVSGYGAAAAAALEAVCLAIVAAMEANILKQVKLYGTLLTAATAAVGGIYAAIGLSADAQIPSLGGTYDHPGVI